MSMLCCSYVSVMLHAGIMGIDKDYNIYKKILSAVYNI